MTESLPKMSATLSRRQLRQLVSNRISSTEVAEIASVLVLKPSERKYSGSATVKNTTRRSIGRDVTPSEFQERELQ